MSRTSDKEAVLKESARVLRVMIFTGHDVHVDLRWKYILKMVVDKCTRRIQTYCILSARW